MLVRLINQRPVVIFTRRGHSERGKQVLRRGKMIDGDVFVLTCFHSDDEIVFHAYNNKTCETMRTSITTKFVKEWIEKDDEIQRAKAKSEHLKLVADAKKVMRLAASGVEVDEEALAKATKTVQDHNAQKAEEDKDNFLLDMGDENEHVPAPAPADPGNELALLSDGERSGSGSPNAKPKDRLTHPLLVPDNLMMLLGWLMARLRIVEYRRAGEDRQRQRLILEYELEEVAMEKAAMSLQGLWKMVQSIKRIRGMLAANWEKRWDRDYQGWFYVDLKTGEMSWDPPRLLGDRDLPDPPDEWRKMFDENDEIYYMNPYTGQTSWMSVEDAARNVQKAYRAKQARDFGAPTFSDIVRALRMIREVEAKYEEHPDRLSSMVNYALLLATQRFDLPGARKLYKDAMEISPENPVLLRAYGLFLLATLEAPRLVVFRKVCDMFKNAELRDPGRERFEIAEESMFHWSVVAQRENPLALVNYSLVQQCLVRDYARAERFYHRAIGALSDEGEDPHRAVVIENFELFEVERLPGGEYHTETPSHTVVRNSNLVEERPEWGEWGRYAHENVLKPKSVYYFWLNPITKRASWDEPDWELAYRQRIERSQFVGEKQGWEQYWDPRFETNFFYNVMDGSLTCVDPVEILGGGGEEGEGGESRPSTAAPKTLAQIEADENAPEPEPEPEPEEEGPLRAPTVEEEKAGAHGPLLLADAPAEETNEVT